MKKIISYLSILILLLCPSFASALSVNVSCSAPSSVEVGQTFNVTISGSADMSTYWSGNIVESSSNIRSNSGNGVFVDDNSSTSVSKTYSFTALSTGTATVKQTLSANDENYEDKYFTSNTCSINIVEPAKPSNNNNNNSNNNNNNNNNNNYEEKSANSYLKNINIENVNLSQTFDKETLEYKGVVSGDVEKINIQAESEDGKASIEGLGEKDLVEGINRFELKVIAENGEERIYILEITRKEKNPIEVIINKKKYTVFKKESNVEPPKGFVKTSVVIDKQDVVAYSNEFIDYILVLLVDELGDSSFYIYNSKNSTYIKYTEVKSKDLRLVFMKAPSIPMNYKKTKLKLDNEEVDAYYLKGNNDFKLVYAINLNNGDESFYQYDTKEKTFQRYNSKLVSSVEDFSKKLEVGLVCSGAIVLVLIIIIISLGSSKNKIKKAVKNKKENEAIERITKKEEIKKEDKQDEPEEKQELSKKELKRLKKEEKKRLKQEQKDFLD